MYELKVVEGSGAIPGARWLLVLATPDVNGSQILGGFESKGAAEAARETIREDLSSANSSGRV